MGGVFVRDEGGGAYFEVHTEISVFWNTMRQDKVYGVERILILLSADSKGSSA